MLLTNKRTGKMILVDDEKVRQDRMVRRLRSFWRAMDGHTENVWFLTLTYRHDVQWEQNHIRKFTNRLKEQKGYKGYCWVAEVQPNTGRVHYHVIVFGSRPAWVTQRWGKGFVKINKCWSVGYILKYLWKGKGGAGLPKGARRFGVGLKRGLLCKKAMYIIGLSKLPAWVAQICEEETGTLAVRGGAGIWYAGDRELVNEWRAW